MASGLAPGRLAPGLQIAAQTLVGAWVGSRFIGFDWRLLRGLLFAAATSFLAAFAGGRRLLGRCRRFTGAPFADALAAFAPGGLEAMTMMAFALGLDPLFVGAHHIGRFLFISLALPWAARRLKDDVDGAAIMWRLCAMLAKKASGRTPAMLTWLALAYDIAWLASQAAVCGDGFVYAYFRSTNTGDGPFVVP